MFPVLIMKQSTASNSYSIPGKEVTQPSSSLQLPIQLEEYAEYSTRCNMSEAALGRIKKKKICGFNFYFSPDWFLICIPTTITLVLAGSNIYILWTEISTLELSVVVGLLLTAFASSFLLTCTDPGVYPRLNPNEEDPLGRELSLVYCRVCGIRRPPRTSHCYVCGVCVLEHDHHCKIIGGCVGIRSLRWFILYLFSVAFASLMGLFWTVNFFLNNVIFPAKRNQTTPLLASAAKRDVNGNDHLRANSDPDSIPTVLNEMHIGAVFLFVFNISITLAVGGMAFLYLILLCSSTTRREMQRRNSTVTVRRRLKLIDSLMHTIFPPQSMLEHPKLDISGRAPLSLV